MADHFLLLVSVLLLVRQLNRYRLPPPRPRLPASRLGSPAISIRHVEEGGQREAVDPPSSLSPGVTLPIASSRGGGLFVS